MRQGVIDFETDPFSHDAVIQPFASCIYFGDNDNCVIWADDCAEQTYNKILQLPQCELYAHNGGKFDFWYLWEFISSQDVTIINGRIAKMTIGNATLIDSYLIAPIPLDKYKKTEIDYDKFLEDVREHHRDEIIEYLISDCRHTLELVRASHKILGKKLTIGGAAMDSIRKTTGVKIKKCGRAHDDRFRKYFFGGRVEAIKTGVRVYMDDPMGYVGDANGNIEEIPAYLTHFGNKPGYAIDVNSAYPAAMCHDHAHGKKYDVSKKLPSCAGSWFAEITAISNGALPLRNEHNEIDFPRNTREKFFATGWEIYAGIETGTLEITKIHAVYKPANKINFKKFVFYHKKRRDKAKKLGDKLTALIHKTCGNSGYGKFASDPDKYYDWCVCDIGQDPRRYHGGRGYEWYSDFAGRSLWRRPVAEDRKENSFFDVATAASITGYQRSVLWRALNAVVEPIYCDTDSIICTDPGSLRLDQDALGAWKIESRPVEAIICAKKIYGLIDADGTTKTASKGVRLSIDDMRVLMRNKKFLWKSKNPIFSIKNGFYYLERNLKIA